MDTNRPNKTTLLLKLWQHCHFHCIYKPNLDAKDSIHLLLIIVAGNMLQ